MPIEATAEILIEFQNQSNGGCFGLDDARFARGRVNHLLVGDTQNILPMLQTNLVWQQSARREVSPAQGSRYDHEIRHQDQDQKSDEHQVGDP